MRKVLAISCGALMALSVPAFAQSTSSSSPTVSQPTSSTVVNYRNGLEALGQANPNQNNQNNPNGPQIDPVTGLIIGGVIVGGIVGGVLLTTNNSNNSVSP